MSEDESHQIGDAGELMVEHESKGSVARGVGQVLLFHLLQVPLAGITMFLSLAVICVSQLAYVIPAIVIARRKGHENTVKGIIIAASLTALLNVACTGYLLFGVSWR
jgi:hypothetical protein